MKLNFTYATVYDSLLTEMSKKKFSQDQIKEMKYYKEEFEAYWKKDEKKILKEIETVSKLKFKADKVCYLVHDMKYAAISNPLTLKKHPHMERAKTILIHELIHILLEDNKEKVGELINKSYPYESTEFKIHVPILLITRKVVENIYGKEEVQEILNDEMKRDVLNAVWPTVNSMYTKFKGDIVGFLKNEKLR